MIDEKKLIAEIREKIYPEKFGERRNSMVRRMWVSFWRCRM